MEIGVFYCDVNAQNAEALEAILDLFPEEIIHEIQDYKGLARWQRIASKVLLVKAFEHFLDGDISFLKHFKRRNNKPYLENTALRFSISHSENICCLAATLAHCDLGIDIEYAKPIDAAVFQAFLHPNEQELISKNGTQYFYEIWTRKEAALKAAGLGVQEDLSLIDASRLGVNIDSKRFYTRSLNLVTGYVCHIASAIENPKLLLFQVKV